MAGPTAFPELNAVLQELVGEVQAILAGDFCGAYLQGSFALGAADEHSDVDFVVVTERELTDDEVARLRAMHARLHALESTWAQHLEGSYIPRELLRRVDPARTPLWFLDNGATELVLDSHCNTAVVRWVLERHGIALAGPDVRTLVEPVAPDDLRSEALAAIAEYRAWAHEPQDRFKDEQGRGPDMSRWKQPYLVLTLCRLLHTLDAAVVASKAESGAWALRTLGPEWAALIQRALDDRPDPWARVDQPADPELVARTLAFSDYAVSRAEQRPHA